MKMGGFWADKVEAVLNMECHYQAALITMQNDQGLLSDSLEKGVVERAATMAEVCKHLTKLQMSLDPEDIKEWEEEVKKDMLEFLGCVRAKILAKSVDSELAKEILKICRECQYAFPSVGIILDVEADVLGYSTANKADLSNATLKQACDTFANADFDILKLVDNKLGHVIDSLKKTLEQFEGRAPSEAGDTFCDNIKDALECCLKHGWDASHTTGLAMHDIGTRLMRIYPSSTASFESRFVCFGAFLSMKQAVIAYELNAESVEGWPHKVCSDSFLMNLRSCAASMMEWASKPESTSQVAALVQKAAALEREAKEVLIGQASKVVEDEVEKL